MAASWHRRVERGVAAAWLDDPIAAGLKRLIFH